MTKTNRARMYEGQGLSLITSKPNTPPSRLSVRARKAKAVKCQQKANLAWLGAALALVAS